MVEPLLPSSVQNPAYRLITQFKRPPQQELRRPFLLTIKIRKQPNLTSYFLFAALIAFTSAALIGVALLPKLLRTYVSTDAIC